MRISGFTILRDAIRLGYPFEVSIRSLLPLVDELIVGVGDGDDGTWEAVQAIQDQRLKPFRSGWPVSRAGREILSQQTNLALGRCAGDWAMYLQADEVLHEDDLDLVRTAMRRHLGRSTEGLLFDYYHFWRRNDLVCDDWEAFYPRAVRAVKPGLGIRSAGDACGFRRFHGDRSRGLLKSRCRARIYHYGWCNPPERQLDRIQNIRELYGLDRPSYGPADVFGPMAVRRFRGTHPALMQSRVGSAPVECEAPARWPAMTRAVVAMIRSPRSARGWARPLLPVPLTNSWWRVVEAWHRRSEKGSR